MGREVLAVKRRKHELGREAPAAKRRKHQTQLITPG